MIVSEFQLPLRRLPLACRRGAAIALADGPSLAEYSIEEIRECGATLCCYGRSAAVVNCKHYWIWDFSHCAILKDLAAIENVYACGPVFESEIAKQITQHHWQRAVPNCSFHPVVELVEGRYNEPQEFTSFFVLGVDGYRRGDGSVRQYKYAKALPQPVMAAPEYFDSELAWQQINNSLNLYMSRSPGKVRNLGPTSSYTIAWGVDQEVLLQPFGRLDRQGAALVLDCTGNYLKGTDSDVCHYSPLPFDFLVNAIRQTRFYHPQSPIFVRCGDSQLERFNSALDGCDMLCGGSTCQVASDTLFSSVSSFYLPCPSD